MAICIWPIFLIWYVYNKTNWSEGVKGITTVAIVLVFIVGLAVAGSKDPVVDDTEQVKTVKTHTPNAQTTPEPAKYVFDVPSLVGKNIDEIRAILGTPQDGNLTEPNKDQIDLGVDEWDNTFKKDGVELLITYTYATRKVVDLFISGTNKNFILEQGNLKETDSKYTIQPVKAIKNPSSITGIKIIPK